MSEVDTASIEYIYAVRHRCDDECGDHSDERGGYVRARVDGQIVIMVSPIRDDD